MLLFEALFEIFLVEELLKIFVVVLENDLVDDGFPFLDRWQVSELFKGRLLRLPIFDFLLVFLARLVHRSVYTDLLAFSVYEGERPVVA